MDNFDIIDKHYWEQILTQLNRMDDNSARRYRRYNKSLDAMGEKTIVNESSRSGCMFEDENNKTYHNLGFLQSIENDVLYNSLSGLNSNEILIILFVYDKGLTFNDIAAIMNSNYDTVQKRHYRAIDKLKKNLLKKD